MAGKLEFKDEATMRRLLLADYFRGPDSTGLAAFKVDGSVTVAKMASHPIDLFDTKKFQEVLNKGQAKAYIGHNRLATKGKINAVNAHPYQYGHITGAHNGTLDRASWMRLETAVGETFEVDSQAIFACIAKIGIDETIKLMEEGMTSSDGAWALTWVNTEDNTLNMLRNKHRPLWYGFSEDFSKLFWASEWAFIETACSISSTDYKFAHDAQGHRYSKLKENWHYRFDLDALKAGATERPKPRVKELKGREPIPVVYGHGGYSPFPAPPKNGQHSGMNSTNTGATTGQFTSKSGPNPDVLNCLSGGGNPFGGHLTAEEFDAISIYGCSWCKTQDIQFGEPGLSIWLPERKILCRHCSGHTGTKIYLPKLEILPPHLSVVATDTAVV